MPNIGHKRAKIVNIHQCLGCTFFHCAYQMSETKFDELVELLKPYLPVKQRVGPNLIIPVELKLSITIQYFVVGSPLDFITLHGISYTSIWNRIWRIVVAINECEQLRIRFHEDHSVQKQIAAAFKEKSNVGFDNCVGAIDGLLICTEKPTEKFAHEMKTGSRAFYCGCKN
jgi:hypothetical protein